MSERSAITEAKKGSSELLILAMVEMRARHGYEIARLIEDQSAGSLKFTLASLYATLYRLEDHGWVRGKWIEKPGQRRRRYYQITDSGKKVLSAQREDWSKFMAIIGRIAGVRSIYDIR